MHSSLGGSLKGPITLLHVIFNHLSQGSSLYSMFGARAALVVPGSRIPRPPKREGKARRRRDRVIERSDPSTPPKTVSLAPFPREQRQIALQESLAESSSILLKSRELKLHTLSGID